MAADQGVVDSVSNVNTKNLGDQPAFYVGLSMRGAVEASNAYSALLQSVAARSAKYMLDESPTDAESVQKLFSDGVAQQLSALGGAIAGLQSMIKGAQTTPPVSAPGPVTGVTHA